MLNQENIKYRSLTIRLALMDQLAANLGVNKLIKDLIMISAARFEFADGEEAAGWEEVIELLMKAQDAAARLESD